MSFTSPLLASFTFLLVFLSSCHSQETEPSASKIVNSAKAQIGKTLSYDPAYRSMSYPMGDIPIEKGVCTDVVIRALRDGHSFDLQKEVHLDMKAHFTAYPKIWGLKRPDKNIDHRRVPNLHTFFKRKGWNLKVTKNKADYLPGDIILCTVNGKLPHIMIVSDITSSDGIPLVIHNIGAGAKEENRLFDFPIYAHVRVKLP